MPGEPGGCEDERVPVGGSVHGVSPPTQLRYVASLRAPLPSPLGGGKARAEAAVGSFSRVRGKVARASATEGGGRLRRCVGHPPPPRWRVVPRHSSVALMAFSPPLPRGQALKSLHRSDFAFGTARSPASGRGKAGTEATDCETRAAQAKSRWTRRFWAPFFSILPSFSGPI